jgi:hypothetical protein
MFPPELDRPAGEIRRVRRVGRHGRPLTLVVAVVLLAVFWGASVGLAVWGLTREEDQAGALAAMAFWTLVVGLLLWRVWRGGARAIRFMAQIGRAIGSAILAGMAVFVILAVAMPSGEPGLIEVVYLLPGICSGAALLTAGILLRRREVREWAGY